MNLDQTDLEILEAAYYDEPWHVLCGMVEEYFEDIRDLVPRVLKLESEGLLEIKAAPGTASTPTIKDLVRIATEYPSYGTADWPEGPTCSVKTTEEGFKYIEDRFT